MYVGGNAHNQRLINSSDIWIRIHMLSTSAFDDYSYSKMVHVFWLVGLFVLLFLSALFLLHKTIALMVNLNAQQ